MSATFAFIQTKGVVAVLVTGSLFCPAKHVRNTEYVGFMAPPTCPECFALTLLFKQVALDYLIHGLDFLLLEFHRGDAGVELIKELAEGRKNGSTESQLDQCLPPHGI